MIKKITTHEADALSRIITQYKGDRGLERMIKSGAVQVQDLENAAFPLFSRLSIDSMIGKQLDLIGDIVGQNRQGQDDVTYRIFLKAKIGINTSSGTIEDVLSVWKILVPGANLELTELFPAEISLSTDAILTDAQKEFLKDFDDILSAGVRLSNVINYDQENAFAFGEIHDEILDSGEVLPYDVINTYGFDFDGATGIDVYINPMLSSYHFSGLLTFKYNYYNTANNYIFSSVSNRTGGVGLIIYTTPNKQLILNLGGLYFTIDESLIDEDIYTIGYSFKETINTGGVNNYTTISFSINGQPIVTKSSEYTELNFYLKYSSGTSIDSLYCFGNQEGRPIDQATKSTLADFVIYNETLSDEELINISSGGFDSTDSRIVFCESFNQTTKGTIIGTEQYAVIGTTQTPDANEGEQYILTTSPLSQDDELYTCINNEWIQTSVSLGYEVSSLSDGLIYKYVNNGTYNVFEEYEENENTGGFGDFNDSNVGGELATIL